MEKLTVNFEGTYDPTGYLFSLAKCLSAALRCGGYEEYADDIIASSGFAFRLWIAPDLCPSGTSIWEFRAQKPWVENGGLICGYVERLWGQDSIEEERRLEALGLIKDSVDRGIAAAAWDHSGCEWGLATGYDDERQILSTLKFDGSEGEVRYEKFGKLDLPILSVLTVTGKCPKLPGKLVADTKALAVTHLTGGEWCDNPKGIAAYDTLISFVRERLSTDTLWNLEYYLGTFAALRYYAAKFFEKYDEDELAGLYKNIYDCWSKAFGLVSKGLEARDEIAALLENAKAYEISALKAMEEN